MKNRILAFGTGLFVLVFLGIIGIRISQVSDTASGLRKLGKGAREYELARRQLVLTSDDVLPVLLKFVGNPKRSVRARVHAADILADLIKQRQDSTGSAAVARILSEEVPRELKLAALKALQNYKSFRGEEHLITFLRDARDQELFENCYWALDSMAMTLYYEIRNVIQGNDTIGLAGLVSKAMRLPAGKGRLFPLLADYYLNRNLPDSAAAIYRRFGLIKKWWVVGPFDNAKMQGVNRLFVPETTAFDPNARFALASGDTASWIRLERVPASGMLDIRNLFVRYFYTLAYFRTYIHAERECDAVLLIGSNDRHKMWLNDSLVHVQTVSSQIEPDQDPVRVRLRKGYNTLFFKIPQSGGGWGLMCRVTGMNGEAIDDVRFCFDTSSVLPRSEILVDAWNSDPRRAAMLLTDRIADQVPADQALLAIATDRGISTKRRIAALEILRRLNEGLTMMTGEKDLIGFALDDFTSGRDNEVTTEMLKVLASMESPRALDLGLAARKSKKAANVYWGNRLVSNYVKEEIIRLGDPGRDENKSKIARTLKHLYEYKPTAAWPLERIATLLLEEWGDSVVKEIIAPLAMPRQWLHCTACILDTTEMPAFARKGAPPIGAIEEGKTPRSDTGWSALEDHSALSGIIIPAEVFLPFPKQLKDKQFCVLHTTVRSDRASRMHLLVTLPFRYRIYINGRLAGERLSEIGGRFVHGRRYPWQELNFDIDDYEIALSRGENRIAVMYCSMQTGPRRRSIFSQSNFFRLAFADPHGNGITVKDNVIQW